ncbi:MAG: AAA family ATPase, partial [Desulfosarcinaceae bacterium]
HSRARRYKRIFLFERLLFEKDKVRSEDHAMAQRIEDLLVSAYSGLGYAIVRVPVMGIDQRIDFVLAHSTGC